MSESPDYSKLAEALGQSHFSLTTARKAVYRALLNAGPLTMHQIIDLTPDIDRASVYRTIEIFEKLAIVTRLQVGWKYRIELSDQFQPHHHHLFCLLRGRTIELPEDAGLEDRLRKIAKKTGFEPVDHQIEIRGYCPTCQPA